MFNRIKDKGQHVIKRSQMKALALLTIGALMTQSVMLPPSAFADAPTTATTSFKVGKTYNGFMLKKATYSEEARSQVYQFEHVYSGGRVIAFSNKDRNKYFNMHVATPAKDDTGATHILEHTLLSGSERFPSKKAFETLNARSVATEVNAFTGQDATDYVFNTLNDKDFNNLYEFYLDGLFAPRLLKDPKLFQREGWHYEVNPTTHEYGFNGIVFNEIKANTLESGELDYINTQKSLFPNTPYANNSGGVPKDIVNLTYTNVVDTYKKFYQPSNMVLLLYGDMNVNNCLKLLNDRYYKGIKRKAVALDYGKLTPPKVVKKVVGYYDADEGTDLSKKSQMTVSYALPAMDRNQEYTMNAFEYWFNHSNNDIAIECVYDKKYAEDMTVSLNTEEKYPYLSFHFANMDSNKATEIVNWLQKSLEKLAYDGIDPYELESQQKKHELVRQIYKMNPALGSQIFHWAIVGLNVKNDPLYHLDVETLLNQVDEEVLYNRAIETLLDKMIVKNKYYGVAVTIPKIGLGEDKDAELAQLSKQKVAAMKVADKRALDQQISVFSQWLTSPESADITQKIPALALSDFTYKAPVFTGVTTSQDAIKWVKHVENTQGVGRITLYFNLPQLTDLEAKLLPIYESMLTKASTKTMSGSDLKLLMDTYTSGIDVSDSILSDPYTGQIKSQKLMLDTMTLESNLKDTSTLIKGLVGERNFKSPDYIKLMVDGMISNLEQALLYDGSGLGSHYLNASLLPKGAETAKYLEPEYYWLKDIQANFDAKSIEIMDTLKSMHKKLMNKNALVISYTGSEKGYNQFKGFLDPAVAQLSADAQTPFNTVFTPAPTSLGVKVPSKVQYVYKGFNLSTLGHVPTGADFVFTKLLNDEYVGDKIRLEGGAYGGNFSLNNDVLMTFSSYRDPNLKKTLDSIDGSADWLKNRVTSLTEKDLDAVKIPLIASFDQASSVFDLAQKEDYYSLLGFTTDYEEAYVKQIFETKMTDADAYIQLLQKGLSQSSIVVVGSDEAITAEQALFKVTRSALSQ